MYFKKIVVKYNVNKTNLNHHANTFYLSLKELWANYEIQPNGRFDVYIWLVVPMKYHIKFNGNFYYLNVIYLPST